MSLWGAGSYAYDAMGNLTSRSIGVPPVDDGTVLSIPGRHLRASTSVTGQVDRLSFTFQGATPKISVVTSNGLDHTVSYDNAGNETVYDASRAYSPRNLMTTVTDTSAEGPTHQISYGYDYRGVRISRTETPTDAGSANRYFFYAPELQLLSSTVDDSNNVWGQSAHIMSAPLSMNREVVWFAGQPVAEYGPPRTPDAVTPLSTHRTLDTNTPANNLFYTFTDHLGTPLIQTDPSTATVWRAEHEPYGNVYLMRKGSRTDQPLRFPGQETAMTWEGAEENYNIFRWYRAGWGRYTQGDPIGLRGGVNAYQYVLGNPIATSDALGLFCTKDFLSHYFFGKGTPIDLAQVGLLQAYKNAVDVSNAMKSEQQAMGSGAAHKARAACAGCSNGTKNLSYTYSDNPYVNVKDESCLFSLGSSILSIVSKCALTVNCKTKQYGYSCTSTWKLRDNFTDPLSTKESWSLPFEPGTPYAINADWSDYYNGSGGW